MAALPSHCRLPTPFQVPFSRDAARPACRHALEPRGLTGPEPMRTIAPRLQRSAPGPLAAALQRTYARRCGGSESDQVGGRNGAGTDAGRQDLQLVRVALDCATRIPGYPA